MVGGLLTFSGGASTGHNPGMQVRDMRLARGWSQEQLAEASGLSVRTIQRIENGQAPGLASAAALARVFDVEVDQLGAADVAEAGPVSFLDAIRRGLVRYAEFDGRAGRAGVLVVRPLRRPRHLGRHPDQRSRGRHRPAPAAHPAGGGRGATTARHRTQRLVAALRAGPLGFVVPLFLLVLPTEADES